MSQHADRKIFSSRTPANDNPDQVEYRRGFVTRHQVSGWRFLRRRIASGVALHDTRMLVDPLRTQSRSVLVGALVLVTGLAGCFVFSLIRPAGVPGTNTILADRDTAALYVRLGQELHPVLNLTSARLIAGRPDNPTMVPSAELDKFSRGNLIGIPGAPERMVPNTSRDADWTVCDTATGTDAGVTVIGGPITEGGSHASALGAHDAVLVRADVVGATNPGTWLLWNGRRSSVDLGNRAVTSALGLGANGTAMPQPRAVAGGLFNAIPESPPLAAPPIANAGQPTSYPMPVTAPIGAVVTAVRTEVDTDNAVGYYAVLDDGLQPISQVVAAILRNTDSHGLDQPPRLSADQIARIPVSTAIDTAAYPENPVTLVDPATSPLTCAGWAKPAGATTNSLTLFAGATLPLPEGRHTVPLVGGGSSGIANRVALAPGTGYFVQATGQAGSTPTLSSYWVSDTGVRYGISTEGDAADGNRKTPAALGLTSAPLPMPSSVLGQFAPGPTLGRNDALQTPALGPDAQNSTAAASAPAVLRENP
ncbi:type VII secretion protein EccB [Mycobacterium sp. OTB74]|uniref:type VII secretion protein EccB n=1 Tax=Mycobacterium sp. OTB74 TaxID=1853452 RepID=UPI00247395AB|nr:type VII secretion protein EccB [Mycobacterium sp. OTB74]